MQSGPRFQVRLLRSAVTIPTTLLLIILACLATYRSARFPGIPPIDELVDREAEGRVDISDNENAFTYYKRAWEQLSETADGQATGAVSPLTSWRQLERRDSGCKNCVDWL